MTTLFSCAMPSDSGRMRIDQGYDKYWELMAVRRNHVSERRGIGYKLDSTGTILDSTILSPTIYEALPDGGIRRTTFLPTPKDKNKPRAFIHEYDRYNREVFAQFGEHKEITVYAAIQGKVYQQSDTSSGDVIFKFDPAKAGIVYTFNTSGQILSIDYPFRQFRWQYQYNSKGHLIEQRRTTTSKYDHVNDLITYEYDSLERLVVQTRIPLLRDAEALNYSDSFGIQMLTYRNLSMHDPLRHRMVTKEYRKTNAGFGEWPAMPKSLQIMDSTKLTDEREYFDDDGILYQRELTQYDSDYHEISKVAYERDRLESKRTNLYSTTGLLLESEEYDRRTGRRRQVYQYLYDPSIK